MDNSITSNLRPNRPTVGLALRGASTRSVFYIGLLEVLEEQKLPIDYIAAISSGAVVAAAYACGTLPELKRQSKAWNADVLYKLIERSQTNTGIYSMRRVEEFLRQFTRNLRFEDVRPRLGFVAADINKGEEVVLSMGDLARAICATCSVPGVFEPTQWGNRSLVDGGVMNFVPGNVVQQAGIDIVVGIDLHTTKYIFSPVQVAARKIVAWTRKLLLINQADRLGNWIDTKLQDSELFNSFFITHESLPVAPRMFSVLGRSIDLALAAQKKHKEETTFQCDLMVSPETPRKPWYHHLFLFWLTDFSNHEELYQLGRKTGLEIIPKIYQLMADFELQQEEAQKTLHKMATLN